MNTSVLNSKIIVNTLSQFGSKISSVLLSLVTVSLLTRYLGAEKYGWFTLVFTYVSFFTTLADVGYNQTIVREYSRDSERSIRVYSTLFNFKLILIGLSVILALIGLLFFPYEPMLKTAIIIGIVAVAVSNLGSYGTSILQSQLRLDVVAALDIFIKVITVVFIAIFVHLGLNFYYIVGSILIGNVCGLIVEYFTIKDWIVFHFYFDKALIRKILRISIPVGITAFLSILYFKVDTLMLSLMRSPEEVGIYGLSYKLLDNILMLWGLFMASIFPLLSRYYGKHQITEYNDLFRKTLFILIVLSVLVIFLGNTFSFLIMRILGGSKFFASMQPFKILLWSLPLLFLDNVFYNVILSFGKTKYLIFPLIVSLVINVLLNLYAIPRYGYIGASYTTIITEGFIAVLYVIILFTMFKTERQYLKIGI
jgi:O-antigen/teichoic acid export membrane protein